MNKSNLITLAVAAMAATSAPAFAANLMINGDFETPITPTGSFTVYGGGSSFTGWNVTGPSGNAVLLLSTTYSEPNITFQAQSGLASMDLTGAGNTGPTSGINQDVTTVFGRKYALTFWVGNADGSGNSNYLLPSTVNLSINGGGLVGFTNSTTTTFQNNWQQFNTTFVATGTTTNIAFFNGTGRSDAETGLDSVSLQSAVPEPASWALMLGGFFGLGAVLRRIRRAAVAA